jgi:transposase
MLNIGVDQSKKKHDVCFMDSTGRQLARFEIPHSVGGFQRLDDERRRLEIEPQECCIALESAHSLLVDYLLDHDYQVYVVPGKAVDRFRDRHRQSQSASDQGDAVVLADAMRTDRHRFTVWQADTPLTRQLASEVRLLNDLKRSTLRYRNRLEALLLRYYPVATELFHRLDVQIALQFVLTYPTPQLAKALSESQFTAFCHEHRYTRSDLISRRYAQLQAARTYARCEVAAAYASQAQSLARVLHFLVEEREQSKRQVSQTFEQHPDAHIFSSLPGAGDFLAPALLSKFGDCRARFPDPTVVQAVAGTSPVTIQSGKRRSVQFRRACDREFRFYANQFARSSISQSPSAAAYYYSVLPRCDKQSKAYRLLANRWMRIIWRLWMDRVEYDETVHLRNVHTGRQPQ